MPSQSSVAWIAAVVLLLASWTVFAVTWWQGGFTWNTDASKFEQKYDDYLQHVPMVMTLLMPLVLAAFVVPKMMAQRRKVGEGGGEADVTRMQQQLDDSSFTK